MVLCSVMLTPTRPFKRIKNCCPLSPNALKKIQENLCNMGRSTLLKYYTAWRLNLVSYIFADPIERFFSKFLSHISEECNVVHDFTEQSDEPEVSSNRFELEDFDCFLILQSFPKPIANQLYLHLDFHCKCRIIKHLKCNVNGTSGHST